MIGGLPGVLVVFAILCALAGVMYLRSRLQPIDASNVNASWEGDGDAEIETVTPVSQEGRP